MANGEEDHKESLEDDACVHYLDYNNDFMDVDILQNSSNCTF